MRLSVLIASACILQTSCSDGDDSTSRTDVPSETTSMERPDPFDGMSYAGIAPLDHAGRASAAAPPGLRDMPVAPGCADGKRTCADMHDCEDAYRHLDQCGMTRLDRDRDGVPCESICGHH